MKRMLSLFLCLVMVISVLTAFDFESDRCLGSDLDGIDLILVRVQ